MLPYPVNVNSMLWDSESSFTEQNPRAGMAESNQEGSHFFPTEKIWKPILAGIPFVCIATQNFLKRVRDLGFKTYDTVWDESYDEEEMSN